MQSDISPVNEMFIEQALGAGLFGSRGELLDAAVSLLRDEEETLAAIRAGLESIDRGEGMELDAVDAMLRERHGFGGRP
jgi:Arc/MetJ-type ribon-helix-helix transcriptional regulator